jgi:hypothetical protein
MTTGRPSRANVADGPVRSLVGFFRQEIDRVLG